MKSILKKKMLPVISMAAFSILTFGFFSSCGDVVNDVKDDIEADIEQAQTETYFRLYGLFENKVLLGTIGNWNCEKIELLGTKGYFKGLDADEKNVIKGSYFYMEKPSSGEYYKKPDHSGTYTDDYQSPDDFSEGELWLNVQYEWKNGEWEKYTDGGSLRDGVFYMVNIDIPKGENEIKSANTHKNLTKDDYDRRKADAHDYASHMFHYALEFLHKDNKYRGYDDITEGWFEEEYPERKIIEMMDKLESALDSDSNVDVKADESKNIIMTLSGLQFNVQLYDYNGYDTDLIFTEASGYKSEIANSDYFGLISYATPHWHEKVWLRDHYPHFSALFDDVLEKATDIKMEQRGEKSYFRNHYDMNMYVINNLDKLEEKDLNPTITKDEETGRFILNFDGAFKIKARVLTNLLSNTPDVEFTSVSSEDDAKVKTAGLWGLYEYSGNTYSPNIARNERLWLRRQYPKLNTLIESIIEENEN